MDDLVSTDSKPGLPPERQEYCGTCKQCGGPLLPYLYFCNHCGMPYKSVESVTGRFITFKPVGEEAISEYVPQVWTMFWVYVTVIVVTSITAFLLTSGGMDKEVGYPLAIFVGEAGMGLVTGFYAWKYRLQLKTQFRLGSLFKPWMFIGLAILIPVLAINFAYHGLIEKLVQKDSSNELFDILLGKFGLGVTIVLFCVLPGILEEIAFRGLLQSWLGSVLRPRSALLLASALFAGIHGSIISFPYLFGVGMLLGLVYMKTRSLWPCMILHFLHNFVVVLVYYYM